MGRTLNATTVKATLLSLLDEVEDGEEIEITRHGRVIARLIPGRGPAASRGMFAGIVTSNADDEDLFSTGEVWDVQR